MASESVASSARWGRERLAQPKASEEFELVPLLSEVQAAVHALGTSRGVCHVHYAAQEALQENCRSSPQGGQHLAKFGPQVVEVGAMLAVPGPSSADVGQSWSNAEQVWSIPSRIRPNSGPSFVHSRPAWSTFRRSSSTDPGVGQISATSTGFGPSRAKLASNPRTCTAHTAERESGNVA